MAWSVTKVVDAATVVMERLVTHKAKWAAKARPAATVSHQSRACHSRHLGQTCHVKGRSRRTASASRQNDAVTAPVSVILKRGAANETETTAMATPSRGGKAGRASRTRDAPPTPHFSPPFGRRPGARKLRGRRPAYAP